MYREQAVKVGRRMVKHAVSVEWSGEVEVHQNPEVFPPGGILTLTELLVGEFLTWS